MVYGQLPVPFGAVAAVAPLIPGCAVAAEGVVAVPGTQFVVFGVVTLGFVVVFGFPGGSGYWPMAGVCMLSLGLVDVAEGVGVVVGDVAGAAIVPPLVDVPAVDAPAVLDGAAAWAT